MEKLEKWLKAQNWSQKDLADATKTHPSTITRLLRKDIKDPVVSIAVAIERITGGYVKCRDWVGK